MLTIEKINELLNVQESFHASYKLAEILQNQEKREQLFAAFLNEENDLSFDWFTEYFQAEHSDRKGKKQDFTPDGIVKVASELLGSTGSNVDLCAGTGGLTIKRWKDNRGAIFYCEEFSDRAMPFLIFNLAIRNMRATICHGDSLSREIKQVWELYPSEQFSDVQQAESTPEAKYKTAIMNPPYSLPWEPKKEYLEQERFKNFDVLAPKSKADYAFLLTGFDLLEEGGTMSIILPHGVLFRGQTEGAIRKTLIDLNCLDTVIGLPEKAFIATDIPTVILVLKKSRPTTDILFVDASKEFTKMAKQNVVESHHVEKILKAFNGRTTVDKFCRPVSLSEIKENDYNLNIPRYIDTFEPEAVPSFEEIMTNMIETDRQIEQTEQSLAEMMSQLVGTNPESDREIKQFAKYFSNRIDRKHEVKKKPRKQAEKVPAGGEQLSLL